MNFHPPDQPLAIRRKPGRRGLRRWLPYLAAAALVLLLTIGLWPQPAPAEMSRAAIGTLRASVNEEGKTRIKQRYEISSPVTGQLRRIPFKPGAQVRAHETVLAVIDPISPTLLDARSRMLAVARRDTAQANFEKALAAEKFAVSESKRVTELFAGKTVSVTELEQAQWREASAAKEKAAAESSLREAEAELAEFSYAAASGTNIVQRPVEVKAPVNGRVLRVFEESVRVVTPGMPLVEIGDPSDLEVVIEVLSRDGAAIRPGTKVELDQWGGSEPLQAQVRLVEPAAFTKVSALGVEEQRVNVIADLLTPIEQRINLGDNFRVEARIIVWEASQALKVPAGALFRRGEDWAVYVISNGRARLRKVQAGRTNGVETQILAGLKEGEIVVLYPGDRIREGKKVTQIKI